MWEILPNSFSNSSLMSRGLSYLWNTHSGSRMVSTIMVLLSFILVLSLGYLYFEIKKRFKKEKIRSHEQLRAAYGELDRRVLERTEELRLTNQQLIESRQAVIKAYAVKSEFLSNMSHEIRTPLNAIIGMASIGFDQEMSVEQREVVSTIKTAADSLLLLVNDILDFSKIEAGKVELEVSDFKLSALCRNAIEVVSSAALSKEIGVSLVLDPRLPKDVSGDAGRILQILLNLLSNAIKFTPVKGTVEVSAKLLETPDKTPIRIRIEIADSGIGISEEAITRLFQPFSQADSSTARKFGGTGLGLSISKRLTEFMGGKIGVESRSGKGSLFWLEVPLNHAYAEVPNEVVIESSPHVQQSQAQILVAEDNPANQKVMRRFLDRLGYRGTLVADGIEAVETFRQGSYDIVFMDCQMPEMDGYEAARKIREIERDMQRSRTPVVALTAHAFASDRELTQQAGMDDYLTKPLSLKQLEKTILFWLERPVIPELKTENQLALKSNSIDLGKIKELEELNTKNQPDIVCEIIDYFFSYGTEKFQAVQQALEISDLKTLERSAHALKSVCLNLGAKSLTQICEQLETSARGGEKEALISGKVQLKLQLTKEFEAASAELGALVVKRRVQAQLSKV